MKIRHKNRRNIYRLFFVLPILSTSAPAINIVNQHDFAYIAKCLGAFDVPMLRNMNLAFQRYGGKCFANYIFPRSLNEYVGYANSVYYTRTPLSWILRHKLLAKEYIREKIGAEHVVKTYATYDSPEDIDLDKLPNQFVIKAVIGFQGHQVIVVKDKNKITRKEILKRIAAFDYESYKWQMNRLTKNKYLAEEYLEGADGQPLEDYKFFCSMGKAICCRHHRLNEPQDDLSNITTDDKIYGYYSVPDWQLYPIQRYGHHEVDSKVAVPRPKDMDTMLEIIKKISADLPIIRCDLYAVNGRVLVGELTYASDGGFKPIMPMKYDFLFGNSVEMPDRAEIEQMIAADIEKYGDPETFL
jgi:hypothetical protein